MKVKDWIIKWHNSMTPRQRKKTYIVSAFLIAFAIVITVDQLRG